MLVASIYSGMSFLRVLSARMGMIKYWDYLVMDMHIIPLVFSMHLDQLGMN